MLVQGDFEYEKQDRAEDTDVILFSNESNDAGRNDT
jgi:hypothetical protein